MAAHKQLDGIEAILPATAKFSTDITGMMTVDVGADEWLVVAQKLRDTSGLDFVQLSDLCAVDYSSFGESEWGLGGGQAAGFSRAVKADNDPFDFGDEQASAESVGPRYAVVVHLISLVNNARIRLRTFCEDNDFPRVDSLVSIWSSANWYEREAFDLFGIMFEGHPDLRRLLTDYGFVGHPFRKDFPLTGQVEMRYDDIQKRVIYEPVSIDPRTLVPRVIRHSGENPAEETPNG